jgi:thiol:disulfide interchange protein
MVFAETEKATFSCALATDKTEVSVGDEVVVTFSIASISNFGDGILGVSATLEYPNAILEYEKSEALNDWSVNYNDSSKIIVADRTSYINKETSIAKFTFKVKETTEKSATIKMSSIQASGDYYEDDNSEEEVDVDASAISTKITIAQKTTEKETASDKKDTTNTSTDKTNTASTTNNANATNTASTTNNTNTTNTASTSSTTSASSSAQKTTTNTTTNTTPSSHASLGAEDNILIVGIILVLAGIAVISIIKYRDYKKI